MTLAEWIEQTRKQLGLLDGSPRAQVLRPEHFQESEEDIVRAQAEIAALGGQEKTIDAERIAQIRKIITTYKPDVFYAETVAFLLSALSDSQARVRELEGGLKPFAHWYDLNDCDGRNGTLDVPISDLRRARSLTKDKSDDPSS